MPQAHGAEQKPQTSDRGFYKGSPFGFEGPFVEGRQSQKDTRYQKQTPGGVEKQKANFGLVKSHSSTFLTDKTANSQKPMLSTDPDASLGLSSPGITYGTTPDPKNNVPALTKTSESLSSWDSVRSNGLSNKNNTNLGIGQDYHEGASEIKGAEIASIPTRCRHTQLNLLDTYLVILRA